MFLVKNKRTREEFAMKEFNKDNLFDNNLMQGTLLEKEVLLRAKHPFLVGMNYVF